MTSFSVLLRYWKIFELSGRRQRSLQLVSIEFALSLPWEEQTRAGALCDFLS